MRCAGTDPAHSLSELLRIFLTFEKKLTKTHNAMATVFEIKEGMTKEEIQEIGRLAQEAATKGKGVDVKKYAGKLKLNRSPIDIQKEMRDEWE